MEDKKIIVLYQSSTGFTKQYAEWIAQDCGCEAVEAKKIDEERAAEYDMIIYGGWVMGNMIVGFDKLQKLNLKKLIVFAVGSTPDSETVRNTIAGQNNLGNTPFFYLQGGFRFKELKLPVRLMLKALKKSAAKKQNKTEQEEYMATHLGTSFDISDRRFIEPLVSFVRENN